MSDKKHPGLLYLIIGFFFLLAFYLIEVKMGGFSNIHQYGGWNMFTLSHKEVLFYIYQGLILFPATLFITIGLGYCLKIKILFP